MVVGGSGSGSGSGVLNGCRLSLVGVAKLTREQRLFEGSPRLTRFSLLSLTQAQIPTLIRGGGGGEEGEGEREGAFSS